MRSTFAFPHLRRRTGLGLCLGLALLGAPLGAARAQQETPGYTEQAKATITQLLANREFKPQAGCNRGAPCAGLLAELRAGKFAVVAPAEQSDHADMPSYLRTRKACSGLDPAQVKLSHHTYRATRDFAIYRLESASASRKHREILIFRGIDYTIRNGPHGARAATFSGPPLLPGAYVVFSLPDCRLLATAPAEDGDRFARHNVVETGDHASELITIGNHYFVINLAPIAGPGQDKASWWYALELWDLGRNSDAGLRRQPRAYSFSYRPGTTVDMSSQAAPPAPG